jgi:hypothetical protein
MRVVLVAQNGGGLRNPGKRIDREFAGSILGIVAPIIAHVPNI